MLGMVRSPPQAQFAKKAAEVLTINTSGTNLEKLLETRERCQRQKGFPWQAAQSWGMHEGKHGGRSTLICVGEKKPNQQNRNLLLLLHIFIALRRGKRWSSKIIENTHGQILTPPYLEKLLGTCQSN